MFQMSIHRFSNCSSYKFSVEVVISYSGDKGNVVYKMCIHLSSNGSGCKMFYRSCGRLLW